MTPDYLVGDEDALSCDVLVIGSGAGGATAAAALAAAGRDVLMLEEGPYMPAARAPTGMAASVLTAWRGAGLTMTLGTPIVVAEGRCVGGGTEINSAIFQRAPDSVIAEWASRNAIRGFSPSHLAPYYERVEAAVHVSATPGPADAATSFLRRAGELKGWEVTALPRAQRDCVGTNLCAAGCPTGAKQSMSASQIPAALKHGARLISRVRVQRLIRRGRKVTGAVAVAENSAGRHRQITITANAVFVAAGTLQTPLLLRRSGLGQGTGQSFQVHPTVRLLTRFPQAIDAHQARLPLVSITEFMPHLRFGGAIFNLPTFAAALAEDWDIRKDWLADFSQYAIYYAMIRPEGVGRIRTIPWASEPLITYALTDGDWTRLEEGLHLLSEALLEAGAESVVPSIREHRGWRDPAQVKAGRGPLVRRKTSLSTVHLFSSCPMGEIAERCPVNSEGKLIGADNVVIADASVLPGAPGVNPQATVMALALRSTDAFLASGR